MKRFVSCGGAALLHYYYYFFLFAWRQDEHASLTATLSAKDRLLCVCVCLPHHPFWLKPSQWGSSDSFSGRFAIWPGYGHREHRFWRW